MVTSLKCIEQHILEFIDQENTSFKNHLVKKEQISTYVTLNSKLLELFTAIDWGIVFKVFCIIFKLHMIPCLYL